MKRFVKELRRRKVFNVAIVYGIVSWGLIQVADVGAPALLLPNWVATLVTFLLLLGFPIALVLAWAYDLTPRGIERTPQVDDTTSTVAAKIAIDVPPEPATELAAVAVIPFKNLTPASEYAFLADAIAMELHSTLSRVHQLRVVSRHSSFIKGEADKHVSTIARELNVQYVITGSVAHVGEKIRVIAEVDDAENDTSLWSETYDTGVSDVLATQQQIVTAIISAFGGERLRSEIKQAAEVAATNLDAWGLVQKARGYLLDYGPESVTEAQTMLEDAVELDPDYAIAQVSLGLIKAEKTVNGISDAPDRDRESAVHAVERAESEAPQDPVVLRTAGCVRAYSGDYKKSEDLLRRAVSLAPFDLGAWGYLGWPLAAKGDADSLAELIEILDRLLSTAPRHPGRAYWLFHKSVACSIVEDPNNALDLVINCLREQPHFALAWMHKANVLGVLGQPDDARAAADECMRISPRLTPEYYADLMSVLTDQANVIARRTGGLRSANLLA